MSIKSSKIPMNSKKDVKEKVKEIKQKQMNWLKQRSEEKKTTSRTSLGSAHGSRQGSPFGFGSGRRKKEYSHENYSSNSEGNSKPTSSWDDDKSPLSSYITSSKKNARSSLGISSTTETPKKSVYSTIAASEGFNQWLETRRRHSVAGPYLSEHNLNSSPVHKKNPTKSVLKASSTAVIGGASLFRSKKHERSESTGNIGSLDHSDNPYWTRRHSDRILADSDRFQSNESVKAKADRIASQTREEVRRKTVAGVEYDVGGSDSEEEDEDEILVIPACTVTVEQPESDTEEYMSACGDPQEMAEGLEATGNDEVDATPCMDSHQCPQCANTMDGPLHTPMFVIPCGHTVCASCMEDSQKCLVCQTQVSSLTVNIMLQQVIADFQKRLSPNSSKEESTLPIRGRSETSVSRPTLSSKAAKSQHKQVKKKYKEEFRSLATRVEVLQAEATEIHYTDRQLTKQLERERKQIAQIQQEENKVNSKIEDLHDKLYAFEQHRKEYELRCDSLEEEKRDEAARLALIQQTLKELRSNMDKMKFLAEEP